MRTKLCENVENYTLFSPFFFINFDKLWNIVLNITGKSKQRMVRNGPTSVLLSIKTEGGVSETKNIVFHPHGVQVWTGIKDAGREKRTFLGDTLPLLMVFCWDF